MSRKARRFLVIFLIVLALVFTVPSMANLGGLLEDIYSSGSGGGGSSGTSSQAVSGVTLPSELVF